MSTQIEGLTEWAGKQGEANPGRLALPPSFDKEKFVGNWTKNDHSVHAKREPEVIRSEGLQATGWEVWRDPKTKKPCIRTLNTGAFILLYRPKVLQLALNKAYGNVSKNRMIQEAEGETLSVSALESGTTQSMLTKKTLDAISGHRGSDPAFEGNVILNSLTSEQVSGEQAEVRVPDFLKKK